MEKWNERLAKALEVRGHSQIELARYTKKTTASVSDWVTGETKMLAGDNAAKVCKFLRINPDWLFFGISPSGLEDYSAASNALLHVGEVQRAYDVRRVVPDRRDLDLINIPMLDTCASMGVGCLQRQQEDVIETVTANLSSLRNHATFSAPENLALITGYGDSMTGTYSSGDVLLVDRAVNDIKLDAIYVIVYKAELYIKRIQRIPGGGVVMLSDNPTYQPMPVSAEGVEEFNVLGRVVLAWNARKL